MWDIGQIIGNVIGIIIVIACLLIAQFVYSHERAVRGTWKHDSMLLILARVLNGIGIFVFVLVILSWFPYEKEYFYWESTGGEVVAIEKRMMADGEGMTENFVVVFEEGQQYRCDDTRCSLVKPGDHLTLNCKKEWQWAATDGYTCRFGEHLPAQEVAP